MLQLLGVHLGTDQKLWMQLCQLTRLQIRYQLREVAAGLSSTGDAVRELEAVSICELCACFVESTADDAAADYAIQSLPTSLQA